MTLIDVKKALLDLLKSEFPDYKYYSTDVIEAYDRPCFFTQLKPLEVSPVNYNTMYNSMAFYITYLQKSKDEVETLRVIDRIKDIFGLFVKVGSRAIDVKGFDWDYVGIDRNIPQITINLELCNLITHQDDSEVIDNVEFTKKVEDE